MEVIVAKTAGFCFGVDKAVNTVNELIEKGEKHIYTLGPIIHNEQVVNAFAQQGVRIIDNVNLLDSDSNVVIRAHGVIPEIYEEIEKKGLRLIDATCPYVKKIHKLVKEKYDEDYKIIIIGDKEHPEVKGINGWCNNNAYIINTLQDAEALEIIDKKICVVAQTTITNEKWESITKYLEKKFENIIKFDTICSATNQRQVEASEIAKSVDFMIIIGGRESSNTQKLYEISSKYCLNTIKIEMPGDLPLKDIIKFKRVGITAGASTPDWVIKEVIKKMSELNKQENEMSFKDAFESSLVTLHTGDIVKGKIIGFNNAEIFIDMGFKSDGIISVEEFSDDPDFKASESLKIGEEMEVFVIRVNDGEGNVLLSKKKVEAMKTWDKIEEAFKNKTTVSAKVVEIVNGGAIANVNGVKIFVPASQISDRYIKDLKEFLKQPINIRIIEFNKEKRKFVGSARIVLEEQKASMSSTVWENIEIGKKYSGTVKSFMDFGAFVDIGGVDGLVHISELSWTKIKHPSEVFKIGDKVEVKVLEFDKEKKRISLGYRKMEDNPWNKAIENYKVGDIVKGKVARLVPFGAFIELEKGIDGLVHISQISNQRIAKPGDVLQIGMEVEVKITEANMETKKIGLSIKDVNPIDPVNKKSSSDKEESNGEADIATEHKEEMPNTIGEAINESKDEE